MASWKGCMQALWQHKVSAVPVRDQRIPWTVAGMTHRVTSLARITLSRARLRVGVAVHEAFQSIPGQAFLIQKLAPRIDVRQFSSYSSMQYLLHSQKGI
jgi:hypothetical protein